MGKDGSGKQLNAFDARLEIKYDISKKIAMAIGYERLSGTDQLESDTLTNYSFSPLYGTNHKFNGWMDYFYVGNHVNSVGLQDIYISIPMDINDKNGISLTAHNFSAAADVVDATGDVMENNLGYELDLLYTHKVSSDLQIKVGYSQLFGTATMERIKSASTGSKDELNTWAWVMMTVKPTFFTK